MKILIPTAKEMSTKSEVYEMEELSLKSRSILEELLKLDLTGLAKLYKLKEELATREAKRWQEISGSKAKSYKALNLFDGLMYRNISRETFDKEDTQYLLENVFITSSFYGIINVFDKISEHRLDFLQNIKIGSKSLKNLWREDYDKFVEKEDVVISLLSSEFEEVFSKESREKFIKIIFMEEKDGVRKIHSTISKKARGKFLSCMVKNRISNLEEIKKLGFENYKYREDLSTVKELVFVDKIK